VARVFVLGDGHDASEVAFAAHGGGRGGRVQVVIRLY
jgi:hypothetical protein